MSTSTQDLARQIDALTKAGIDPANIYVDKKSGATTEHPGLLALLAYARTGDVIVVHTLDRIARTVFLPPCGRHFTELRIETARVPPHVAAAGIGRVPLSDTGGCGQWSAGHHSPSPRWGFLACLTEGSLFGVVLYLLLGVASTLGFSSGCTRSRHPRPTPTIWSPPRPTSQIAQPRSRASNSARIAVSARRVRTRTLARDRGR